MLDVHPPHQPAHSWKDFFIHIATIAVGLLIAIGLEQTVEAVHRHHERTVLRRDIHAEASDNVKRLEKGRKNTIANVLWVRSLIKLLREAPLVSGR